MIIATNEHAAITRQLLWEQQRSACLEKQLLDAQEQRKQIMKAGRQKARYVWELGQQIAELKAQLAARPRAIRQQIVQDAGDLAEELEFWARMAWRFAGWWWGAVQRLETTQRDNWQREQWARRLFANQSLDPGAKLYEWGLQEAISSAHIHDKEGRALIDAGYMRDITGIPEKSQQRYRETLQKAGAVEAYTVFDKAEVRSHTYIALLQQAQLAPDQQEKPADAPQRGGNRRHVCGQCGSINVQVEEVAATVTTCRDCGNVERDEAPPRLIYSPTLPPLQRDPWEEVRTETRYVTSPVAGEPLLMLPSKKAPDVRRAAQPCIKCGSWDERLKLGEWVCLQCYPSPLFKKGA